MMYYIGIDPGQTGAMAVLSRSGEILCLVDWPGEHSTDISLLRQTLNKHIGHINAGHLRAAIEKVTPYKMGRTSAFHFGGNWLAWQTAMLIMGISFVLVPPQIWKKVATFTGKDKKKASLVAARLKWPGAELHLAKHHNRAEALWIAEWLRLQNMNYRHEGE